MSYVESAMKDAGPIGAPSPPPENLALLYQGLLTGIVRMQSRRQRISDAESFRRRTKTALQDVERDAVAAGYDGRDVRETHFAVVAFLDSVVLNSNEPVRAEWERKTLQEELFGQTDAGVVFFDKLEAFRSRPDSKPLSDILEVYLLCLLLGFQGRYSGGLRGELDSISERLRMRIENIRGQTKNISPGAALSSDRTDQAPVQRKSRSVYYLLTLVALIFTILCFLVFRYQLIWTSDQIRRNIF